MTVGRRYFWALALCFFLSGCSYQKFGLPPDTEPAAEVGGNLPVVEAGQEVTVVTLDGKEHEGEVVSASPDRIVLGKTGNYGFEESVFAAKDIAEIKRQEIPKVFSVVLIGSVAVFGLLLLAASQIEWPAS